MIISPFTPLFFSPSTDKFGAKSKYVQLFARTDRIFVELILTCLLYTSDAADEL